MVNIALWAMGLAQQLLEILDSALKDVDGRHRHHSNVSSDYQDTYQEQEREQMEAMRDVLEQIKNNIDIGVLWCKLAL